MGMPGPPGAVGATGATGPEGPPGSGGGGGGGNTFFRTIFSSNTTEPPNNQRIEVDTDDQTLATKIWVDRVITDGSDITNYFRTVVAGDEFYIQDQNDATIYQFYTLSGDPVFKSGYVELPVVWDRGEGAIGNSQSVLFTSRPVSSGGGGGDLNYLFTQSVPDTLWDITHNLGKFPSTTVVDSSGNVVYGDVQHLTPDHLQVSFSAGFSGQAFLN